MASCAFLLEAGTGRLCALQRKGETSLPLARSIALEFFSLFSANRLQTAALRGSIEIFFRYHALYLIMNDVLLVVVVPFAMFSDEAVAVLDAASRCVLAVCGGKPGDVSFDFISNKKHIELLFALEEVLWTGADGVQSALDVSTSKLREPVSKRQMVSTGPSLTWDPRKNVVDYRASLKKLASVSISDLFLQSRVSPDDALPPSSALAHLGPSFFVRNCQVLTDPKPMQEMINKDFLSASASGGISASRSSQVFPAASVSAANLKQAPASAAAAAAAAAGGGAVGSGSSGSVSGAPAPAPGKDGSGSVDAAASASDDFFSMIPHAGGATPTRASGNAPGTPDLFLEALPSVSLDKPSGTAAAVGSDSRPGQMQSAAAAADHAAFLDVFGLGPAPGPAAKPATTTATAVPLSSSASASASSSSSTSSSVSSDLFLDLFGPAPTGAAVGVVAVSDRTGSSSSVSNGDLFGTSSMQLMQSKLPVSVVVEESILSTVGEGGAVETFALKGEVFFVLTDTSFDVEELPVFHLRLVPDAQHADSIAINPTFGEASTSGDPGDFVVRLRRSMFSEDKGWRVLGLKYRGKAGWMEAALRCRKDTKASPESTGTTAGGTVLLAVQYSCNPKFGRGKGRELLVTASLEGSPAVSSIAGKPPSSMWVAEQQRMSWKMNPAEDLAKGQCLAKIGFQSSGATAADLKVPQVNFRIEVGDMLFSGPFEVALGDPALSWDQLPSFKTRASVTYKPAVPL